MTTLAFGVNLAVAFVLGTVIGLERQWRQRMAGLRTNALVATGSALFCITAPLLSHQAGDEYRIAAQVVSGIGFVAGGVIFREGANVRGLNTASTLWCSAAVGVLAGFGLYLAALAGTLFVLAANVLLRPVAQRINRQPFAQTEISGEYTIRIVCRSDDEAAIRELLLRTITGTNALILRGISSEDLDPARLQVLAEIAAVGRPEALLERVVARLSLERGVSAVSWRAAEEHAMAQLAEA